MLCTIPCFVCGKRFKRQLSKRELAKGKGRFCSQKCYLVHYSYTHRKTAGVCIKCGKTWTSQYPGRKYCGKQCYRKYEEGRYIDSNGYVRRLVDREYVKEHRWVVERQLGRRLLRSEQVHHINGVKYDNRPENLQVLSPTAHSAISAKKQQIFYKRVNAYIRLHPEFLEELNKIEVGEDKLAFPLIV